MARERSLARNAAPNEAGPPRPTHRRRRAAAYNAAMATPALRTLGSLDIGRFLREYWQHRPLLVRGALPAVATPGPERLFALAAREDVESRLVTRRARRWTLRHGPFARRALPPLRQPGWTLLVQGVDLVDATGHELMSRFRFLPDARLDDLMASYASDRGGVGPHVDNYDVFLLQTHGRRRWRISHQQDLPLRRGQPLRLLAGFRATEEWVLEPGDLLYLPPGVAHDGVALGGDCITCSVGFRTPTYQELLDPWLARFAASDRLGGRYADRGIRPTQHPATLPAAMVRRVHAALARARPGIGDTRQFLLEHFSEPKPHVVFQRPARTPAPADFARLARRRGVALDARTRILTAGALLAVNGELVEVERETRQPLQRLADRRRLPGTALAGASGRTLGLLRDWFAAGWLRLGGDG